MEDLLAFNILFFHFLSATAPCNSSPLFPAPFSSRTLLLPGARRNPGTQVGSRARGVPVPVPVPPRRRLPPAGRAGAAAARGAGAAGAAELGLRSASRRAHAPPKACAGQPWGSQPQSPGPATPAPPAPPGWSPAPPRRGRRMRRRRPRSRRLPHGGGK